MESAFGVEHGEISKGLPSAVKRGGGGTYGSLMRLKNKAGKSAAQLKGHPGFSDTHRESLKYLGDSEIKRVKSVKPVLDSMQSERRVAQHGPIGSGGATRRLRAELLNEDSAARRRGFKTGKSSALDRHYRGRVGDKMTPLP